MNKPHTTGSPVNSLSKALTRRVLLLSLIGVLGLGGTIALSFLITINQTHTQLDKINLEAASVFDAFFLQIQGDLQSTSDGLITRNDQSSALLALRIRNKAFLDVLLLSPDGVILNQRNAVGRPKQTKIKEAAWLKSRPPFGQVVISPVGFEGQTPYVDIAITVTDDIGLPAGLLLVRVDLTELWNTVLDVKVGNTGYAYITDSDGQLVAFRNRRLLEAGNTLEKLIGHTPQTLTESNLSFYKGLSGKVVMASAQPLKTVPWFAVVEQPIREVLSPFILPALILLIILTSAGLLLYNTIQFTQVRIVSPLLGLHNAVEQMTIGKLEQSIEVHHNDELGQLARAFNQMAGQLQQAFAALESQVYELQQVQKALLDSESRFRLLAENSSDIISQHDEQGNYLYVSPACRPLLGYEPEELIGRSVIEFIHPEDVSAIEQAYSNIINQPVTSTTAFRVCCKNGMYIWLETTSHTIFDKKTGALLEINAASRDVTKRKQAEEVSAKYASQMATVAQISLSISAMLDMDKLLLEVVNLTKERFNLYHSQIYLLNNQADALLLIAGAGEVGRQMAAKKYSIPLNHEHSLIARAAREKQNILVNDTAQFSNFLADPLLPNIRSELAVPLIIGSQVLGVFDIQSGEVNHFTQEDINVQTILAGQISVAIQNAQEFTARKQAEEKIYQMNIELEERVVQRTTQLQAANKELEAFSYSISHDLRTPLRAIDGFTRILLEDYDSVFDAEGKRISSVIRNETQRMGELIDDLLAFSRINQVEIFFAPIDMSTLVQSVFNDLTANENQQRIEFNLEPLYQSQGNPHLIRQVWVNLLGNAIKFSSKRERTMIQITNSRNNGEITYSISDNGAGFDMQYSHKLFSVFQRLHTGKEFPGTGVGLAIVQRIINRHGGRIWAESAPDQGSIFHFTLLEKEKKDE